MSAATTVLCVLDGLGLNPDMRGNAVKQAQTPNLSSLLKEYPNTTLATHGERVGLPSGQMGNSEVGHLNIGAGRVVEQWLVLIEKALKSNKHLAKPEFGTFLKAASLGNRIHLIGLFSCGGVHSDLQHLLILIDSLLENCNCELALHLITDGRDVGPESAATDLINLQDFLAQRPRVKILTIQGRFYAMDRDQRWERVEQAYANICGNHQPIPESPVDYLKASYNKQVTDEFIEPACFQHFSITPQDCWLFWNFRADRMREIVAALCLKSFDKFTRTHPLPAREQVLCFANYASDFNLPFLFAQEPITNYLGMVVAKSGLQQLRVAETEKYPHVTYFLNGGSEQVLNGEERILIPSPRDVRTYDLKPEMSALAVKQAVVDAIKSKKFGLIVVNFANCDMVGHTGVLAAAIKAVETVDDCLGAIFQATLQHNGNLLIIADHGNAEQMINYADGSPHTAHTTYPVPCILVSARKFNLRDGGALCDVAPTVLELMGLEKPLEMTGQSLISGASPN